MAKFNQYHKNGTNVFINRKKNKGEMGVVTGYRISPINGDAIFYIKLNNTNKVVEVDSWSLNLI
jgi:hypothetical protein